MQHYAVSSLNVFLNLAIKEKHIVCNVLEE